MESLKNGFPSRDFDAGSSSRSKHAMPAILEGAEFIAKNSPDVIIKKEALDAVADQVSIVVKCLMAKANMYSHYGQILDQMTKVKYSTSTWNTHTLHPKSQNEATVDWIFLVDLLNFSFWSDATDATRVHTVTYKGQSYTGYWTLCACINRALDAGIPMTSPSFFADLTLDRARDIFQPDNVNNMHEMPLLEERVRVMNQAGRVLRDKYQGSFVQFLKVAGSSAQTLIKMLIQDFGDIFDDSCEYMGRPVHIMKRAQILVADLWACFDGQGFGQFDDIDSITIFADYRVPQALVYFGLIEYSPSLMQHLKEQETDASRLFKNGESLEVQIRGCSIWTAELLRQKIAEKITLKASSELSVPNAILLDFYIWDFVYKNKALLTAMNIPFHRVRCIYY